MFTELQKTKILDLLQRGIRHHENAINMVRGKGTFHKGALEKDSDIKVEFKKAKSEKSNPTFIMELPPYRMPITRSVFKQLYNRVTVSVKYFCDINIWFINLDWNLNVIVKWVWVCFSYVELIYNRRLFG